MDIFLGALLIFILRIGDVSLATMRFLIIMRGSKTISWLLGFVQAIVFIVAITKVLTDLGNWANVLAYSAGFATGTVVGLWLEELVGLGYGHVRIISSRHGAALADALRAEGFGVTLVAGRGRDGTVDVLNTSVPRRQVARLRGIVTRLDPEAFITIEMVRPLARGHFPG